MAEKEQQQRDWDKELAEVDRLLAQQPVAPPPTAPRGGSRGAPAAAPAAGRTLSKREWLGTWVRVVLGLLIGIGMTQWPYTYGCGFTLAFYLLGVVAVIAAGVWSGISSWRRHLGLAHLLSQGLVIWGLVLGAREVLPRVHYAAQAATWFCSDAPAHHSAR